VVADGAYAGPKLEAALRRIGRWTIKIVKPNFNSKRAFCGWAVRRNH